jgi:hypothetical protein
LLRHAQCRIQLKPSRHTTRITARYVKGIVPIMQARSLQANSSCANIASRRI